MLSWVTKSYICCQQSAFRELSSKNLHPPCKFGNKTYYCKQYCKSSLPCLQELTLELFSQETINRGDVFPTRNILQSIFAGPKHMALPCRPVKETAGLATVSAWWWFGRNQQSRQSCPQLSLSAAMVQEPSRKYSWWLSSCCIITELGVIKKKNLYKQQKILLLCQPICWTALFYKDRKCRAKRF